MAKAKGPGKPRVATIIFLVIIAYFVCFIILFLTKRDVRIYEVTHGDIAQSLSSSGLILREEKVYNAPTDGNITFFNLSGVKVKVNDSVYVLDKTGNLAGILDAHSEDKGDFSNDDLKQLTTMIRNFETDYDYSGFSGIYDIGNSINTMTANQSAAWLESNKDAISKETGVNDAVTVVHSDTTGYLSYSTDGYEGFKEEDITEEALDRRSYEKKVIEGEGAPIKEGTPAYKMITDELYSIYIPLTDDQIKNNDLEEAKTVYVNLKKVNAGIRGNFEIVRKNNLKMGKITVNKYVMAYTGDRYAEVEISTSENMGLKIPNSAIVKRDMYAIPEEYLTVGGDTNETGVNVQKGDLFVFTPISVATKSDGICYVKLDELEEGNVLIKPESTDTFTVGKTEKIDGVYCVNTGYTIFRPTRILTRNDEYAVVFEGSTGVQVYDRIVLDAENFKENEVIY